MEAYLVELLRPLLHGVLHDLRLVQAGQHLLQLRLGLGLRFLQLTQLQLEVRDGHLRFWTPWTYDVNSEQYLEN